MQTEAHIIDPLLATGQLIEAVERCRELEFTAAFEFVSNIVTRSRIYRLHARPGVLEVTSSLRRAVVAVVEAK